MSKKVLIVDNSLISRQQVKACMKDFDCQLLEARNGKEAVGILEQHQDIRLIFTEWNLPWMTGYELIQHVKNQDYGENIAICIATAERSSKIIDFLSHYKAAAYLIKPISKEQVLTIIQSYLRDPSFPKVQNS